MSSQPLLPHQREIKKTVKRHWVSTLLIPVLLVAGVVWIAVAGEKKPKDPFELANYYLKRSPVIDGHIDVPEWARMFYGLDVSKIDLDVEQSGQIDIPRIRKGHLGGFFWSIYTACPDLDPLDDFVTPRYEARDALEQLDVAYNLIRKYPDVFQHVRTADEMTTAIGQGKVGSIFGLEGAHSLGSSMASLRMFYELGVRYMTLTHVCNNAVADSGGLITAPAPKWGGLSPFGVEVVKEMNRLGIIIDLSHTGDKAAEQALAITRAPVMLSHSCPRGMRNISRNVPDHIMDKVGRVGGVIMVNFAPGFLRADEENATEQDVADHLEYMAARIGRKHLGIGSDFDGLPSLPQGLKDASQYPNLFAELIRRGWSQEELAGLAGGNILRVLRGVEAVAAKMRKEGKQVNYAVYEKRTDLHRAAL